MSVLADRIRSLSAEVLKNTRSLTLNNVRGSRGVPLRISHPSGANLEFKNGKVYYNGSELLSSNNNPPGTDSTSFTIDMDNESAGVDTYLCFNRGSTGEDATLMWDEVNDEFRLWKDKDSKTTLATLGCGNIGCQYMSLTHLEVNNLIDSINSTIVIGKDLDMNSNDIIHCNSIAAQGMPINIYNGASIYGDLDMNAHSITNVADPVNNQDVATKKYVDDNSGSCDDCAKLSESNHYTGDYQLYDAASTYLALAPGDGTASAWFALDSSNRLLVTSTNNMYIYTTNGTVWFHDDVVIYNYNLYLNMETNVYLKANSGDMELHVPSGHKVKIVVG